MKELRPYKVYAIKQGTVIDHIPKMKALDVIEILGINGDSDSVVTLGMNMNSKKYGKKDVVKIEKKELTKAELNKIALVAPYATINIIRDFKIAEKFNAKLPNLIEGIVKCGNPNCITRHEPISTRFYLVSREPLKIKCHHCEKIFKSEDIQLA